MLFTFDHLHASDEFFPAKTWLAFQTPRTEMGPLRLLKTCEPRSLSHIRTKLFSVYLLLIILKEYKRQDRSHVTTDGLLVRPSFRPAPPGAHDQICVR